MIKKVFFAVLLVALSFGSAFADQIDSLGSGVAGQMQPPTNVYVNPGGTGDALIYGYYNVRNANSENFFNVVNTSATYGVRARIRFIEGPDVKDQATCSATGAKEPRGSIEVLDFDICLTPNDVWTGQIRNKGGVATLFSTDSDTYVDIAAPRGSDSVIFSTEFPNGQPFSTDTVSASDTLEGYFIVIAENQLTDVTKDGNCGPTQNDVVADVDNVLMGLNMMVDLDNLQTFGYNATALGDFSNIPFLTDPVDASPNLADCSPDCAGSTPKVAPVNYALTKSNIFTTYDLEGAIGGKTEMIVTYPTKNLSQVACPANDLFDDTRVKVTIFNDKEEAPTVTCRFSPCPGGTDVELPFEVNVVKINNGSTIFTSDVETLLSTAFDYGWINLDLTQANTASASQLSFVHATSCLNHACQSGIVTGDQVSLGLPAIGYTALDIANAAVTQLLPVQYKTSITGDQAL